LQTPFCGIAASNSIKLYITHRLLPQCYPTATSSESAVALVSAAAGTGCARGLLARLQVQPEFAQNEDGGVTWAPM